ncbi:hypothetical protein [Salmonirosea aquatica]|uniref:Uncharacterized protein n=1 Tax=Salmonirosea aquatica TaxID=2654236 RepID=A0A7C9FZH0_9BACT|nr:hypothetical protein [Cytophagaceae bacterium SJW1-29]
MSKFKLNDKAGKEDYVFVGGNTKYLATCSQKELEVLHANGDARVDEDNKSKTDAPAEIAMAKGK